MADPRGIVAAGHPLTAEAGARVLREGGNAVDAAIAALLVSWVCEPLLTGPGAGGYLLVAGGGDEPTLLDFFVAAPGRASTPPIARRCCRSTCPSATPTRSSTCGAASCRRAGHPGRRSPRPPRRWGSVPLADLAAPAVAAGPRRRPAHRPSRPTSSRSSRAILRTTPEARAAFAPGGRALRDRGALRRPRARRHDRAPGRGRRARRSTRATSPPPSRRWWGPAAGCSRAPTSLPTTRSRDRRSRVGLPRAGRS